MSVKYQTHTAIARKPVVGNVYILCEWVNTTNIFQRVFCEELLKIFSSVSRNLSFTRANVTPIQAASDNNIHNSLLKCSCFDFQLEKNNFIVSICHH